MKHTKSPKTTRPATSNTRQESTVGRNGIAIEPPAYGIDFMDRGLETSAPSAPPVQLQGDLEEEELLQGKFDPVQRQGDLEEEELLQGKFATSVTPMQFQTSGEPSENRTGMPDQLKAGLEQLGGVDLSGVRVHYNSPKPAQLNALAYAQGHDIHLGPRQEKHLPHEGWHAVQQMQGRVKPTMQAKGVAINDETALEREADQMGARAVQCRRVGHNARNVHDTFSATQMTGQACLQMMSGAMRFRIWNALKTGEFGVNTWGVMKGRLSGKIYRITTLEGENAEVHTHPGGAIKTLNIRDFGGKRNEGPQFDNRFPEVTLAIAYLEGGAEEDLFDDAI